MAEHHSMSSQLSAARTPEKPEVTNVYDTMKGTYHDAVCGSQNAPAYMPLPATPSPFASIRKP